MRIKIIYNSYNPKTTIADICQLVRARSFGLDFMVRVRCVGRCPERQNVLHFWSQGDDVMLRFAHFLHVAVSRLLLVYCSALL